MKKLLVLLTVLFSAQGFANPRSIEDFKEVTVTITNAKGNSGGSGTVLKSSEEGSTIITNAHVCELTVNGGYVNTTKGKYAVQKIQKATTHDLCLVYVSVNLDLSSVVATATPEPGDNIRVSGHPFLLPHMLVEGHLSDTMQVSILTDVAKCGAEDFKEAEDMCYWMGGIPIVREYNATTASALIAPGNSGSAVYNDAGEIIALVFAGNGRGMSPAILVPHEYIVSFLKEAATGKWEDVSKGRKLTDLNQESRRGGRLNTHVNLQDIINVDILPASKDARFDHIYNKLAACRGNLRTCLRD